MRFQPGAQLGAYELVGELGAGGMGEVYRARDTVLGRDVAIKLVHPQVCDDASSIARLRREARLLASLNHPNVATIHELADFDGMCGIVMELVAGETLADILRARTPGLPEILRIAVQIAAALESAHESGVVHRDLKPANIKITPDGTVKVLDFGLAKSDRDPLVLATPHHTTVVTDTGILMGTACYMSPEQARGAAIDRRTDMWAFGCVVFEMITGRRPFTGKSVGETLVEVLEREPNWSLLPATTPEAIRKLLRRCLEKDPRRRMRDAGDARLELEEALAPAVPAPVAAPPAVVAGTRPRWIVGATLLALGALLGGGASYFARRPAASTAPSEIRFVVPLPAGERLGAADFPAVAIAPDGSAIVYVTARGGTTQLAMRVFDRVGVTTLPGTTNATSPFFSPDGEWIAFFADGQLKKVGRAGGPPVVICDADGGFGGTWRGDDIVFADATGSPLSRVSAGGGTPVRVTRLDTERSEFSHRWPEFLPDSHTVLFTVGTVGEWDEAEIVAQRLDGGERKVVVKGGTHPHYLASGHLLYTHAGAVWSAPFDASTLALTGPPSRVVEDVVASVDGAAQFAVSRTGTIVYSPAHDASGHRLLVVDGSDQTPLAAPPRTYGTPRVSPEGRRLLLGVADSEEHVWLYDLSTGTLKQLTFDAANRAPIWHPDGRRITYSSNRGGALNLFMANVDDSAPAERLTSSSYVQLPASWSPDGNVLAYVEQHPTSGRDIWLLDRRGNQTPLANSNFDESAPRFSPDGRWIAYVSTENGSPDVYVRAATGGPSTRVTTTGATEPVWTRDGRSLLFRSGNRLVAAAVQAGASWRAGSPRVVFEGDAETGTLDAANYDAAPGDRLVIIEGARDDARTELQVVVNWRLSRAATDQ